MIGCQCTWSVRGVINHSTAEATYQAHVVVRIWLRVPAEGRDHYPRLLASRRRRGPRWGNGRWHGEPRRRRDWRRGSGHDAGPLRWLRVLASVATHVHVRFIQQHAEGPETEPSAGALVWPP